MWENNEEKRKEVLGKMLFNVIKSCVLEYGRNKGIGDDLGSKEIDILVGRVINILDWEYDLNDCVDKVIKDIESGKYNNMWGEESYIGY